MRVEILTRVDGMMDKSANRTAMVVNIIGDIIAQTALRAHDLRPVQRLPAQWTRDCGLRRSTGPTTGREMFTNVFGRRRRRRLVGRCAIYQTSSRYRHLGATTTGVRRDNNISTEAIGNVLPARPCTYYT